jgi:phospholipase D1/2
VRVYVQLGDATDLGAPTAARERAKAALNAAHPNIICVDGGPGAFPTAAAHGQRFVVVDRTVAVLGVDWALGRWDSVDHPLFDPDQRTHPGADYCDAAAAPRPADPAEDVLDRREAPRRPWHDLAVQVWGGPAGDVAANFVERWNHARADSAETQRAVWARAPSWCELGKTPPDYRSSWTKWSNAGEELHSFGERHPLRGVGRVQVVRSAAGWSCGLAPPPPPPPPPEAEAEAARAKRLAEIEAMGKKELAAELKTLGLEAAGKVPERRQRLANHLAASVPEPEPEPETSLYAAWATVIGQAEHYIYVEQRCFVSSPGDKVR